MQTIAQWAHEILKEIMRHPKSEHAQLTMQHLMSIESECRQANGTVVKLRNQLDVLRRRNRELEASWDRIAGTHDVTRIGRREA